jgi:MFS family permease
MAQTVAYARRAAAASGPAEREVAKGDRGMSRAKLPRWGRTELAAGIMLGVLVVFYVLNAFDRTILSLMVVHVKRDLHVADSQVGLLLGLAFAIFYGTFGIPVGVLIDRVSRRIVLFGGVVLWSLATVGCAFTGSFGQLLVARMFLGVGEATLMPAAHSLLADGFPARRLNTALSIYALGGVLGVSLSAAVGGVAVAHFSQYAHIAIPALGAVRGWQFPFVILGVVGLALAALAFSFSEPARRWPSNAGSAVSFAEALAGRRLVVGCILTSYVTFSMVLYGVVLWTPTFMARTFHWTPGQVGPAYAMVHIVGAGAGTLLGGMVVDRLVAKGRADAHFRVFLACLTIGAPAGILAFLSRDPTVFLVLATILFFFAFSYSGYAAAAVQAVSLPGARGRMAAMYQLLLILGGSGMGPWLIGLITDNLFHDEARLGLSIVLMIAVLTPISMLAAWLGLKPMRVAVAELARDGAQVTADTTAAAAGVERAPA